tara:strand:- start:3312 stop:3665 length:354 start_codon:yes stop_codon:yes gene_type:complete
VREREETAARLPDFRTQQDEQQRGDSTDKVRLARKHTKADPDSEEMGVAESENGDVPEGLEQSDPSELPDPTLVDVRNQREEHEDDSGACGIQVNGDVPVGVSAYIPVSAPVDGNPG